MSDAVRIGPWSMLLLVLGVQLLILAAAVLATCLGRRANQLLALTLVVIAGLLTPFILGYAGAYDAWPWLSFAPFAVPLALGPLLFAYVTALAEDRSIHVAHWLAPTIQFALTAAVFPWPLETKNWFDATVQEPFLSPITAVAVLASMTVYGVAGWRTLQRYEAWLRERRRDPRPARRLRAPVAALLLLVAARAGYEAWDALVEPVDYFDLFAYYIALGALGLWIGLDGWRGAHIVPPAIEPTAERDWPALGRDWIAQLEAQGWWRDEALDLDRLARLLGTNTSHASRALNAAEGSVTAILARLRATAVARRLDAGDRSDLLTIALEEGFGSKASFNRAFRAAFGTTPTAYRDAKGKSVTLHVPLRRANDG